MIDIYDYPLYRPPSEAFSLIIQITLGCSHNKCTFCSMYKSKKFRIKTMEKIKQDIDNFRAMSLGRRIDKIFLADGDALIVPTATLVEILDYIKIVFPECERVSIYGTAIAIERKSVEELKLLYDKGLTLVYLGVESGDDEALKFIRKGATSKDIIRLSKKIMSVGIDLSITLIAGLLGKGRDNTNHAVNTAHLIEAISPKYASILNLIVEKGTYLYDLMEKGEFDYLDGNDILKEMRLILASIDPEKIEKRVIFRANHGSNYLTLKGDLPFDIPDMINKIDRTLARYDIGVNRNRRL